MRESKYQRHLIEKIKLMFPGAMVLKNDPAHLQGVPDLLILFRDMWAALEVKISRTASVQPNQTYYVEKMHDMSFASFISPEVEEDVLDALQRSFETRGASRVPES